MARTILKRLRFSNADIKNITWMVYNHMAIDDLPNMRPSKQHRMLGHPAFEDLLELHRVDAAASWTPDQLRCMKPNFATIKQLWHDYKAKPKKLQIKSLKYDLGIDGNWLLKNFSEPHGLQPSPIIGTILHQLEAWYQDENITDEQLYVDKARELLEEYQHENVGKNR